MGQFTPNIGLFIPAAGETNYTDSFASGMINLDLHDHSGGPNKGVPITSSGLANFSVTFNKLAANVADPTTGIGVNVTPGLQHQLQILGILRNLFTLASTPGVGLVSMNGSTVAARTIQDTSTITWNNADGVAGDPSADLVVPVTVSNGGTGINTTTPYAPILAGTAATNPFQQPASAGNVGEVYVSQGAAAPGIFSPLGGLGQIQYATVTLSAAQVTSLVGAPINIVPAPGAGKVLVPIYCYALLTQVGAAFTTTGSNPITVSYNAANIALTMGGANFTGGADAYAWGTQNTLPTSGIAKAAVQNQPLDLKVYTTNYAGGGTSTIQFVLAYTTITL